MALRQIPDPVGITAAKTLPASAYSDTEFHQRERAEIFQRDWVCAGVSDEMPLERIIPGVCRRHAGLFRARQFRDACRAFLNVCRHSRIATVRTRRDARRSLIRCPSTRALSTRRITGRASASESRGFNVADYPLKHAVGGMAADGVRVLRRIRVTVNLDSLCRAIDGIHWRPWS